MRILQIHNKYRHYGGEDAVLENEYQILLQNGYDVKQLIFDNDLISAKKLFHNTHAYFSVIQLIKEFEPDLIHVHNIFYTASPSVLKAAKKTGTPVVMTLHNFRLICPGALFLRNGKICLKCKDLSLPIYGVVHKCFKDSYVKSSILVSFLGFNNYFNTWKNHISKIVVLTPFIKSLIESSSLEFPAEDIIIKPNSTDDLYGPNDIRTLHRREGFLFVGRLSQEKGIEVLIEAFNHMPNMKLEIIGEGPLEGTMRERANPNIIFYGRKDKSFVGKKLEEVKALIFPSIWYEGLPNTIIEAFSAGTPVLASNVDNIKQLITPGFNGDLFDPNINSLVHKVLEFNTINLDHYRINARNTYENTYTHEINFQNLAKLYFNLTQPHETKNH